MVGESASMGPVDFALYLLRMDLDDIEERMIRRMFKTNKGIITMFLIGLISLLPACSSIISTETTIEGQNEMNSTQVVNANLAEHVQETATPAEIKSEEQRVEAAISSMDADKISKLVIEQILPTQEGSQISTYESNSQEAIEAWVNLFQRMEIVGVEFEYLTGGNMVVYIVDEQGETRLGCLEGSYLTNGKLKTMCRITNYSDLYPDIQKAAHMVSELIVV